MYFNSLRTEEIDRHAGVKMRRIRASNLLIIDEVGYLPINATEGNMFFQLNCSINHSKNLRKKNETGLLY